jgi:hypothetical protein
MEPIEGSPGKFRFDQQAMSSLFSQQKFQGRHIGWEVPQNFDRAMTQARFNLLAERLSEIYRVRLVAASAKSVLPRSTPKLPPPIPLFSFR